jgi:hypothetical protein
LCFSFKIAELNWLPPFGCHFGGLTMAMVSMYHFQKLAIGLSILVFAQACVKKEYSNKNNAPAQAPKTESTPKKEGAGTEPTQQNSDQAGGAPAAAQNADKNQALTRDSAKAGSLNGSPIIIEQGIGSGLTVAEQMASAETAIAEH